MFTAAVFLLLTLKCADQLQFENDTCKIPTINGNGKCIKIHECNVVKQLLLQNKRPETCGFAGNVPLVCCPEPGSISRAACEKYNDKRFQVFAIDLGQKALSKEFPHMAAVGYGESNTSIVWLCGGTLISNSFVLSAAHCVNSLDIGAATWIRLGDLDLVNTTEDANPRDTRISEIHVHPEYKRSSHYHDIALFKLAEEVFFGLYFRPACLHLNQKVPPNLQATGWGQIGFGGKASSHLMKANLSVLNYETCSRRFANIGKLKNGILDDRQMCAGDAQGADTCPGDSGGPLHYFVGETEKFKEHFVVAGVTSFGKGCGGTNSAGVYTRVSAYVGWIESVVWKEDTSYYLQEKTF